MTKTHGPKEFLESFSALTRCLTAVLTEMYGDAGIGRTQAKFVRHVARHGKISQSDLARATRTDKALTGRALLGLIERGVVRRERSESDRREYLLELGPEGREVLARVERVRERMAERLVKPLAERDLADFDRIAKKLLDAFADEAELDPLSAPVRPRAKAR